MLLVERDFKDLFNTNQLYYESLDDDNQTQHIQVNFNVHEFGYVFNLGYIGVPIDYLNITFLHLPYDSPIDEIEFVDMIENYIDFYKNKGILDKDYNFIRFSKDFYKIQQKEIEEHYNINKLPFSSDFKIIFKAIMLSIYLDCIGNMMTDKSLEKDFNELSQEAKNLYLKLINSNDEELESLSSIYKNEYVKKG